MTPEEQLLVKNCNVSRFFQTMIRSGQRYVYFGIINNEKRVLKLMVNVGDAISRVHREIEIVKRFSSTGYIPRFIEFIEINEIYSVLIEEYIEGIDLEDIKRDYIDNEGLVIDLLKNLITALIPFWDDRKVHRDIKPKNIRINTQSKPIILDFGIARDLLVASTTTVGFQARSFPYASPQQSLCIPTESCKTDFFSLGVVSYELFYGSFPYGQDEEKAKIMYQNPKQSQLKFTRKTPLEQFWDLTLKIEEYDRERDYNKLLDTIQ